MKKKTTELQLPKRGAMNQLARSGRTILDYAKTSPLKPKVNPSVIQNLRKV